MLNFKEIYISLFQIANVYNFRLLVILIIRQSECELLCMVSLIKIYYFKLKFNLKAIGRYWLNIFDLINTRSLMKDINELTLLNLIK
jgi:hypothetical protein